MTPEQKLEAIKEELKAYTNGLKVARENWLDECKHFDTEEEKQDIWYDWEHWAREGSYIDLEKIVEILDA